MSSSFGSVSILAMVAIQLLLIRSVWSLNLNNVYLSHKCNNTQGKYTPGSVFERNLNQVIRNLSTFDLRNDIPPNTVFVMIQCRGDSYGSKCHSCLSTAISGLRQRCPGNKGGIIWYDQCLLEISTYSYDRVSRIDYDNILCMSNPKNVSGNPQRFNKVRKDLFQKLMLEVSRKGEDGKGPLYATGESTLGIKKLYAMVQCTNDLFENGCYVCQEWLAEKYGKCGDGKQGARVLGRSCNLRYELYPFLRSN
ncbi:hypothetical protein EUTSA_v10021968mg [Eutrema salsugineum]|uniref:Gnk2-homologous domain-containing protein n=1 Tax=Eutrema salsugineum TaxID=72664 RepID=V4LYS6_EUTSA|nr:hypothetical protein EUTSA_v10021968mg [Eutrema salsugineum]